MAVTAKSFIIGVCIDAAIGLACFIAFCVLRRMKTWRRFFAPKRYLKGIIAPPAPGWGVPGFKGLFDINWIKVVFRTNEVDMLAVAGWDAVVYLRILHFGVILFGFLTVLTWVVILPTNAFGGTYINELTAHPVVSTSEFTYWVSPPPPPTRPGAPPGPPAVNPTVPKFYNSSLPPAPAGLTWLKYNAGVPPLPTVASTLGAAFSEYVWQYDSSYVTPTNYQFSSLDKASIANISPKSALLVCHVICAWIMSLATWALLWWYAKKGVALRVHYFSTLPKGAESHTVLVQDIPGIPFGTKPSRIKSIAPKFIADKVPSKVSSTAHTATEGADSLSQEPNAAADKVSALDANAMFQSWSKAEGILQTKSMAQMVEDEFEDLFPGQVLSVETVHQTRALEDLIATYDSTNQKLWDLIGDYSSKKLNGKEIKRSEIRVVGALLGDWGKEKYGMKPVKKDALEYLPVYLDHLRDLIHEEQAKALETDAPVAFVTFKSRRAAAVASRAMINHDLSIYTTSPAPPPETLFWRNIGWREWERSMRSTLIWIAFWALAIFYLIPVAAVQALVNVALLSKIPPFKQLLSINFINAIIVSILPGLVLVIFLALLPMLLTFMNKRAGMQSKAEIDFGVFQKFFIFQVMVVFFGSFIAGSFFSQFHQWLNNPAGIINLLGTAVPQTASFFLIYMAVLTFLTTPLGGLRVVGMILYYIKTKIAATERARARLWQDQFAQYGADVATHTLSMLLGLVYCIIQPVIAPLVLCYFLISLFYAKYQALYVFRPAYESGGKMWPIVHRQVMTGLIIAQLVLTFVFAIKKAIWAPIITAGTIFGSIIFNGIVKKRFFPPQEEASYRGATDGDHIDEVAAELGNTGIGNAEAEGELYLNSAFKFDEEDHKALLLEAENVDLVLKGERGDEALISLAPEEEEDDDIAPSLVTTNDQVTADMKVVSEE